MKLERFLSTTLMALCLTPLGASANYFTPESATAINFKISEDVDIRLENGVFKKGKKQHKGKFSKWDIKDRMNNLGFKTKIKRMHKHKSYDQFELEQDETFKFNGIKRPKLQNWYQIDLASLDSNQIELVVTSLQTMEFIESVQFETPVVPINPIDYMCPAIDDCEPPGPGGGGSGGGGSTSNTPDFEDYQGYLGSSPYGIDADYAWTVSGGNGQNVKIIDMESFGPIQTHEDLPSLFISDNDNESHTHSTAVLGVLAAKNNSIGMTGIAYGSQVGFYNFTKEGQSISQRIINAGSNLSAGDILVLEGQVNRSLYSGDKCDNISQAHCVPMEWNLSVRDAVSDLVSNGVNVVLAAGNGNENLDSSIYQNRFNRSYFNSGAIYVAATFASSTISKTDSSNYGDRIDFNGWGKDVATLGSGNLYGTTENEHYRTNFSGTSSATPIVAGAVASIVGIGKQILGRPLSPEEVHSILSETGVQPPSGLKVGVRPDLRGAIDSMSSDLSLSDISLSAKWQYCLGENTLNWTSVSGATNYKIFISATQSPPSSPTYTRTGTSTFLNVNSDMYGWVQACNSGGCTSLSNSVFLRHESYCL